MTTSLLDPEHTTIAKKLIESMFPQTFNIANQHGNTALIKASYIGQTEIVEELIKVSAKHGIYLETQNKEGDTALHVAASSILNQPVTYGHAALLPSCVRV